jgi:hypothetical protein
MSFNGTGTFVINSSGQPVVSGTVISATVFNALTADLATGLSTCITKDGQTTPTNNIPMGGFKITGLGAGTVGGDAVRLSQLQAGTAQLLTVSGTDTLTALGTPALTAYAAGNLFYFVAAATNTTSVTLNVDGLGAKAVTRHGSTALVAGDILAGEVCLVVYDGTRFQLLNPASYTNLNVSGNLTLNGGTANGVLYLNGSKAATSGSALVFDGSNLGIGTASPGQRLDIIGSGRATGSFTVGDSTGNFSGAMSNESDTSKSVTFAADPGNAGANSFMRFNVDGSERARIDSNGNLGIGTSSPGTRLDIVGANARIRLTPSTGTQDAQIRVVNTGGITVFGRDDSTGSNFGAAYGTVIWSQGAYPMQFATNDVERMRLDSSGNLGIGTSSPGAKLEVYGGASGTVTNTQVGNASTAFVFGVDSGNNCQIRTAQNVPIIFYTNATRRASIEASGSIVAGSGAAALATTATDGFLYVPTCAGTPTGTPTAITGMAPIVVNTTNNKLYFYSGGAWRDAGP